MTENIFYVTNLSNILILGCLKIQFNFLNIFFKIFFQGCFTKIINIKSIIFHYYYLKQ